MAINDSFSTEVAAKILVAEETISKIERLAQPTAADAWLLDQEKAQLAALRRTFAAMQRGR